MEQYIQQFEAVKVENSNLHEIIGWLQGIGELRHDHLGRAFIVFTKIRPEDPFNAIPGQWIVRDALFNYKVYREDVFQKLFSQSAPSPAKAEQEGPFPVYDLSHLSEEDKNKFAGEVMKSASESLMATFYSLGLQSHLDQMSINDSNGDKFILAFRKIVDDKLLGPPLPMASSKKEHEGSWKSVVHSSVSDTEAGREYDDHVTITDGRVELYFDGGIDDNDEQLLCNLLNERNIKLDYDHEAELYASQLEELYKEACAEVDRLRKREQEGLRWVKASDLKELPAGSQFYKHFDEKGLGEFVDGSFYSSTGEIGSNQFIVLEILKEYNPPAHVDPITFAKYAWSRVKSWNKETGEIGVYYDKNSTWDKLLESYRAVESTTPPVKEAAPHYKKTIEQLQPRERKFFDLLKYITNDEELALGYCGAFEEAAKDAGQPVDNIGREEELIYRIVEQWGNAMCSMDEKVQWLKDYAAESRQQPAEKGAVWVKGDYERLYNQIKGGKRTVCYIDHPRFFQQRDICTIKPNSPDMEFTSRGHGYGGINDPGYCGSEIERFIQLCRGLNAEWLDESAGGDQGEAEAVALLEWLLKSGYNPMFAGYYLKGANRATSEELHKLFKEQSKQV